VRRCRSGSRNTKQRGARFPRGWRRTQRFIGTRATSGGSRSGGPVSTRSWRCGSGRGNDKRRTKKRGGAAYGGNRGTRRRGIEKCDTRRPLRELVVVAVAVVQRPEIETPHAGRTGSRAIRTRRASVEATRGRRVYGNGGRGVDSAGQGANVATNPANGRRVAATDRPGGTVDRPVDTDDGNAVPQIDRRTMGGDSATVSSLRPPAGDVADIAANGGRVAVRDYLRRQMATRTAAGRYRSRNGQTPDRRTENTRGTRQRRAGFTRNRRRIIIRGGQGSTNGKAKYGRFRLVKHHQQRRADYHVDIRYHEVNSKHDPVVSRRTGGTKDGPPGGDDSRERTVGTYGRIGTRGRRAIIGNGRTRRGRSSGVARTHSIEPVQSGGRLNRGETVAKTGKRATDTGTAAGSPGTRGETRLRSTVGTLFAALSAREPDLRTLPASGTNDGGGMRRPYNPGRERAARPVVLGFRKPSVVVLEVSHGQNANGGPRARAIAGTRDGGSRCNAGVRAAVQRKKHIHRGTYGTGRHSAGRRRVAHGVDRVAVTRSRIGGVAVRLPGTRRGAAETRVGRVRRSRVGYCIGTDGQIAATVAAIMRHGIPRNGGRRDVSGTGETRTPGRVANVRAAMVRGF